MDSMLDLEQLRLSVNEQDIPSAIGHVEQWISTHGLALLRTYQRLPFDYEEAENIRKEHEKIELKCMTFLAYYAKINLKNIPEQYEDMREDLDMIIHTFSDHIKARRHVVVSYFTLFRHMEKLQKSLMNLEKEDLSNLPDSIEEIDVLIRKFHKNTDNCLKILSHLKIEADRVKSAMDIVVTLNNSKSFNYIDHGLIIEGKSNIDRLLQTMEMDVVKVFESQRLLELELTIEIKMMQIEDDISCCCGWLQKMEQKLVDKYKDKVVGMATVENDALLKEVYELVNKMKLTKDYGKELMHMHEKLCFQFERDTSRGQTNGEKLDELWKLAEFISSEAIGRLEKAGKLFHGLDSTLDKVEDLILSLHKDKQNSYTAEEILDKYQEKRNEAQEELSDMKRSANELFIKLRFDLFNDKLKSSNGDCLEADQTHDMVKMKIYTIAIKMKELDLLIFPDGDPVIVSEKVTVTNSEPTFSAIDMVDGNLEADIERFLRFLTTTQLNWKSKPLPNKFDKADKALKEHHGVFKRSNQYLNDIQAGLKSIEFQSKSEKENLEKLSIDAAREKKDWDINWKFYLDEQLDPIYQFLKRIEEFNFSLENDLNTLDDLTSWPNNTSSQTKSLKNELTKMKFQVLNKEKTLEKLHDDASNIYKTDFDDLLTMDEKLTEYGDRLNNFIELENMIEKISAFLPQLSKFKKQWNNKIKMCKNNFEENDILSEDAERMKSKIAKFDIGKLRKLATITYGNSDRVESLIDELKADFIVPVVSQSTEKYIKPTRILSKQMTSYDVQDFPKAKPKRESSLKVMVNSPTELKFDVADLPKVNKDQYNIQWYKNDEMIDTSKDLRIKTSCEPRTGTLNMKIDNCDFTDSGKYWCEVEDVSSEVHTSCPVNLTVIPTQSSTLGNVKPSFGERVFAGRNDPLTLELKLDGYRFAPECSLRRDNLAINVNQKNCPWTRVSSNKDIEFCHPSITDSDRGKYEIIIADKVVAKTQIIVGDAPKLLQYHFKEKVKIGESVSVTIPTANIINKADQKVLFSKDDTILTLETANFSWRLNDDGDPVFEIKRVKAAHTGAYTCEVSNQYGRTSAQIVVNVTNTSLAKETPIKSNIANDGSIMDKLSASIGDSVILVTDYIPSKNTEIDWTKNGKPIGTDDPRIKITNDYNSKSKLQINGMYINDSGIYTAKVRGTNRTQSTTIEIKPTTKKSVNEKYATKEDSANIKKSPIFVSLLKKEETNRGDEPLTLKCKVAGNPVPTVKWTKDGREVKLSDFIKITRIGDVHELTIMNPRSNDCGTYKAIASNSQGSESCQCLVKIVPSQHMSVSEATIHKYVASNYAIPDDVSDVDQISQRTQLIFANTVVISPPQFITTFTDEIVNEGEEVVLKCRLIGQPEPAISESPMKIWWSYNTHLLNDSRFEVAHQSDEYCLIMHDVKETDSGRYSITAENSSGLATCSALVIVQKNDGKGKSLDRSQYKTNSKPRNQNFDSFPIHTTLSNTINPSLPDESRIMQVSPRGWDGHQSKSSTNRSYSPSKTIELDVETKNNIDFSKTKTTTVKTYRYSGPSGVDLPGIGFIPKLNVSSRESLSSEEGNVTRAVFVPGKSQEFTECKPAIPVKYLPNLVRDSVVESSECDYPL